MNKQERIDAYAELCECIKECETILKWFDKKRLTLEKLGANSHEIDKIIESINYRYDISKKHRKICENAQLITERTELVY